MQAGWEGLFAVEYEKNAFATLEANLIAGKPGRPRYRWPSWLKQEPMDIEVFVSQHEQDLRALRGQVDLIAGGPPCQGFSFAGRRRPDDRRNRLIEYYLRVVSLVHPTFLLVENVEGIAIEFGKTARRAQRLDTDAHSHAAKIHAQLAALGYQVHAGVLRAADVGVPQWRPRYIMLGVRADKNDGQPWSEAPFALLNDMRLDFLASKGLPLHRPISVREALSDLETRGKVLVTCRDSEKFQEARYRGPRTKYQRLMRDGMGKEPPNSMRLARHREDTVVRFSLALKQSRKGVALSMTERQRLGMMNKHQFKVLDPDLPSHTLTTLPDDILHYAEPRILTVREYARLQGFPDWFSFHGKYTTGGKLRTKEAPRYTQVGNAVPPFMAELLGWLLLAFNGEREEIPAGNPVVRHDSAGTETEHLMAATA